MTIRVLHRGGALWGLAGHYDDTLKRICKETPGMQWSPLNRAWIGYADAVAVVVRRCREAEITILGSVETIKNTNAPTAFAISYEGLRDYQKTGVDFIVDHASEGCICADEMSLGKSAEFLRAARAFKERTVIVCPSFVKGHWVDEATRWWPKAKVVELATTKPTPIDSDAMIAVIHYDVLHAWVDALIAWGARTLGIDELHFLMGDRTRRTEACRKLARTCSRRVGLTGTPMTSRPRDMWAPIDVLSEGRLGRLFNFALRYCAAHREQVSPLKTVWKMDGASNLDELQERLSHFMIRRTKADVAIELPPLTREVYELEVPKGCLISPTAALRSDRILRQSLDLAADGKLPQCIDMVCDYVNQGSKVVVFTYRRAIAKAIAEGVGARLPIQTAVVTGEVSAEDRRRIVKSKPDVLCATMDSLGVGISLAYADKALFAELHYVPSVLLQCEARLHRPDSKARAVSIVYAVARGTSDDIVKRAVIGKLATFQQAVGKLDDKLFDDLNSKEGAAARLKKLYERLLKEDAA